MSLPYNYVTTSVSWAPSGEYFAVGSFDMIRLCNKTGWTYSFNKIDSGSILKLSWSGDGTTVAGAGVNYFNLKIINRVTTLSFLVVLSIALSPGKTLKSGLTKTIN